jgi:mannose-6-phosphate isomerase-like protein (cupin superfamily)
MNGYHENLGGLILENTDYRHVLYTAKQMQLVAMHLKPNESIEQEKHEETDQFIYVVHGFGLAIINGKEHPIESGDCLLIPQKTTHEIINISNNLDLKIFTLYGPPQHRDGLVRKTKREAERYEMEYDNRTTE